MAEKAGILIFGGTGGVGSELARACTARGWRVHLAARSGERLRALAGELNASYSVADVLDEASIVDAVRDALKPGPLSGLAYCVGTIDVRSLKRVDAESMIRAFRINVVGAALCVREAQEALRDGAGSVVLFSTIAVDQGFANHAVISAAKGGVQGLARSLAAELAPQVRVNCIAPSLTQTPLSSGLTSSPVVAKNLAALHPLGRLGEPSDIAAAATFLLGPESAWITGQVLRVDGGRSTVRTKG